MRRYVSIRIASMALMIGLFVAWSQAREKRGENTTADRDAKLLEGEWVVVGVDVHGVTVSGDAVKRLKWLFKGTEITATDRDGKTVRMSFQLDPGKRPKEIDVTLLDGRLKGTVILGIYELRNGCLRVCLGDLAAEKGRPTGFATTAASGTTMYQMQAAEPPRAQRATEEAGPAESKEKATGKSNDQEAVRKVVETGVAAFNKRDRGAFAAVFHDNAEFTIGGTAVRGPKGILLSHALLLGARGARSGATFAKAVVRPGEPRIRFVHPDVATVQLRWTITGVVGTDGKDIGDQKGTALLVLTRENGTWAIADYHLVDLSAVLVTGQ